MIVKWMEGNFNSVTSVCLCFLIASRFGRLNNRSGEHRDRRLITQNYFAKCCLKLSAICAQQTLPIMARMCIVINFPGSAEKRSPHAPTSDSEAASWKREEDQNAVHALRWAQSHVLPLLPQTNRRTSWNKYLQNPSSNSDHHNLVNMFHEIL